MSRSVSLTENIPERPLSDARVHRVLYVTDSQRGRATARARGSLYREFFENDGWVFGFVDVAVESEDTIIEAARSYDAVVLLKVASYSLVYRLRANTCVRMVFDLTDSLWKLGYRADGWYELERILRAVDAVFCENEFMRAYGSRYNRDVRILPTCAQVELFDAARASSPAVTSRAGRVVIGWVGSRGTSGGLVKIRAPLMRLSARYPHVEFRLLGVSPSTAARIFGDASFSCLPDYEEADMVREMRSLDIGLFPVPLDIEDYRVRGPLKALLYMAAGVPAVCQNDGDCARILEDGVTGMLASSEKEWEQKLEALILSSDLRHRIGQAGLARVRKGHTLAQTYVALRDSLAEVIGAPSSSAGLPASPDRPVIPPFTKATDALRSAVLRIGGLGFRAHKKLFRSARIA
jgi:glycosyltransferase involved in cell wall biosynthesis